MSLLFNTLRRGGDVNSFLRTTAMLSLQRKVISMQAAVLRQRDIKVLADAPPPIQVQVSEPEHE